MSGPLLTTKLYVPRARPGTVPRPHLIEQLNTGIQEGHKLTLVSAPAGFGKTTLLAEWAAGSGRPFAWVSLGGGDNDPLRFWAYFIAAVQTILPDVGVASLAALQSGRGAGAATPPPIEPLLTSLINEIAARPESLALVLDDLHTITNRQIHEALTSLLEYLPPQMHLVLSSRADPPWPLARLRARRDMTELRVTDLRFRSEEVVTFLNKAMNLGLSPGDVETLEARTEGWIVGLQMAALSMRGRKDVTGFVRGFAGTHRLILDYLVEEVLDGQPDDVHGFLLKTSILDRMTPPLCDAITGQGDSQAILVDLEQGDLFLIPLDDERRWYRYHHLFADLLRSRLKQGHPDQVPRLHRRAAAWYEQAGLIAEAIVHALEAGDMEHVARLVEENALTVMGHGELTTVVGWLDVLPDEMVRRHPWLAVARAWALLYTGQLCAVEPFLQDAGNASRSLEDPGQIAHVEGHIAAIRAEAAYIRGEMDHTVTHSREALSSLPPDDLTTRSFAAAHLAYGLYWRGDLAAADKALADAHAMARTAGDSHMAVMILCDLATVRIDRGRLRKAVAAVERALQLADRYAGRGGQLPPSSGHTHTYLARVLLEWNDLAGALRHARQGNDLCKLWGQPETLATSYYSLARVLQAMGDTDGALDAMQAAGQLAAGLSPWIAARVSAWEAIIRLAGGDLRAADRWRRQSGLCADDQPGFQQRFLYRALARVLVALGREQPEASYLDQATGLLSTLLEAAEAAGALGYCIEILVLQTMAFQGQGKTDLALDALARALDLAEPEGYVRTFIDEGEPMGTLLRQTAARGITPDYVGKLLAASEREEGVERRTAALIESLSARELEVLRLLATHLSSTEMAQELYISANTVRSHIKNIYGKLNVHSRRDAVERARELGLL